MENQDNEQIREYRANAISSLHNYYWDSAVHWASKLTDGPEDLLLLLRAKYKHHLDSGLDRLPPEAFEDPLWQKILARYPEESPELIELLRAEQDALQNHRNLKLRMVMDVVRFVLSLVMAFGLYLLIQPALPGKQYLVLAVATFACYTLQISLDGETMVDRLVVGTINAGLVAAAAYGISRIQWSDKLYLWAALAVGVLILVFILMRRNGLDADAADYVMHLPAAMLIVTAALNLMYLGNASEALMTANAFINRWAALADLLFLVVVVVRASIAKVKEIRSF